MTTFQDLQAQHTVLLNQREAPADPVQFLAEVRRYIGQVCTSAADISIPRERDQLRAILRFWGSYVYDHTGTYPNTTLQPATSSGSVKSPTVPESKPPTQHTPFLWGVGVLAVAAMLVAVVSLASIGRGGTGPASDPTAVLDTNDRVATQVHEQIIINAAMTKVVAASSTPTPLPTLTPTSTPTETPTPTSSPTATATPTVVIVRPETSAPVTIEVPPSNALPLDVGFQILTQGPSPFDQTVWVMRVKLIGIGGNGRYIFWADNQSLANDEVTVQGARCTPQTVAIGVTSDGRAVKHEITLRSPLAECLKTPSP